MLNYAKPWSSVSQSALLSYVWGGEFLLFPKFFLPKLTISSALASREVPELNWWRSRLGEEGGLSRLGSWRPESAARQAGRAQSLHAWGDGAGMFFQPEAWALPTTSWLLLSWTQQP